MNSRLANLRILILLLIPITPRPHLQHIYKYHQISLVFQLFHWWWLMAVHSYEISENISKHSLWSCVSCIQSTIPLLPVSSAMASDLPGFNHLGCLPFYRIGGMADFEGGLSFLWFLDSHWCRWHTISCLSLWRSYTWRLSIFCLPYRRSTLGGIDRDYYYSYRRRSYRR